MLPNRHILLFCFTVINCFFIVKYGSRQHYLSEYILGAAYSTGILLAIFFFTKQKIKENYSIDFECVNKYSKLNEKIELYSSQEYEQVLLNLVNYIEKNSIDIDEEIYEYIEDNFWDFI